MPQSVRRPRFTPKSQATLRCPSCGTTTDAPCSCGIDFEYISPSKLAEKAIKDNPNLSDRAIADKAGISDTTVLRARKSPASKEAAARTATNVAVSKAGAENSAPKKRLGRDGKMYPTRRTSKPRLRVVINDDEPTDEQCDADEQEVIYDQACLYLKEMTGETRQKFFAYIKRKYSNELR